MLRFGLCCLFKNEAVTFRIMSPLFPRMTHPDAGYSLAQLPEGETIGAALEACRLFSLQHRIRLSFHPDQFVVLSSPHAHVVANSIQELEYQALLAEMLGADVINIHAISPHPKQGGEAVHRALTLIMLILEMFRSVGWGAI